VETIRADLSTGFSIDFEILKGKGDRWIQFLPLGPPESALREGWAGDTNSGLMPFEKDEKRQPTKTGYLSPKVHMIAVDACFTCITSIGSMFAASPFGEFSWVIFLRNL
jgi:hypothetical protein